MAQRLAAKRMSTQTCRKIRPQEYWFAVKELADIQTKGCPDGIEAIDVSGMDTWIFGVSVLGDETIYRVCHFLSVHVMTRLKHDLHARWRQRADD
jgi:hypothetical protein